MPGKQNLAKPSHSALDKGLVLASVSGQWLWPGGGQHVLERGWSPTDVL